MNAMKNADNVNIEPKVESMEVCAYGCRIFYICNAFQGMVEKSLI